MTFKQKHWLNKEDIKNMYYEQGITTLQIAKQMNCSPQTVQRFMHKNGLKLKTDGKFKTLPNKLGTNKLYVKMTVPKELIDKHTYWGKKRRTYVHRYIMELKLGRKLKKGEVVHHKDGNPRNNNPDNLGLCNSHGRHYSDEHRRMT